MSLHSSGTPCECCKICWLLSSYSFQQIPSSNPWILCRKHTAWNSLLGGHLRVQFRLTRNFVTSSMNQSQSLLKPVFPRKDPLFPVSVSMLFRVNFEIRASSKSSTIYLWKLVRCRLTGNEYFGFLVLLGQQLPQSNTWVVGQNHPAWNSLLGGHLRVTFHLPGLPTFRVTFHLPGLLTSHRTLRSNQHSPWRKQCALSVSFIHQELSVSEPWMMFLFA